MIFKTTIAISVFGFSLITGHLVQAEELAATRWRLLDFQSMDDAIGTVRPSNTHDYIMTLNADGSVAMKLNCNQANGQWQAAPSNASSGSFSFGPLAVTRALCPSPSLDEQIARDSAYIRSYQLRDGELYLALMADAGIYHWEPDRFGDTQPIPYASPDNGGPRNWVVGSDDGLNMRAAPSTSAPVNVRYAAGTVLDNLGCAEAEGRTWCEVQKLGGGPVGFMAAEYLKPAIAPDGGVALGPDDSASRAGQGLFDATGRIACGNEADWCDFAVARAGGGDATVVITRQNGQQRVLYFHFGKLNSVDGSEASGFPVVHSERDQDDFLIDVDDEHYRIPEAVIYGG